MFVENRLLSRTIGITTRCVVSKFSNKPRVCQGFVVYVLDGECSTLQHERAAYTSFCSFCIGCLTNVALLYPLETENRGFSDIFRGYRSRTLVDNELKQYFPGIHIHRTKKIWKELGNIRVRPDLKKMRFLVSVVN